MRLLDTLSLAVIVVPTKSLTIESPLRKKPRKYLFVIGAMKVGKCWRFTHPLPQLRPTPHHQPFRWQKREKCIKQHSSSWPLISRCCYGILHCCETFCMSNSNINGLDGSNTSGSLCEVGVRLYKNSQRTPHATYRSRKFPYRIALKFDPEPLLKSDWIALDTSKRRDAICCFPISPA